MSLRATASVPQALPDFVGLAAIREPPEGTPCSSSSSCAEVQDALDVCKRFPSCDLLIKNSKYDLRIKTRLTPDSSSSGEAWAGLEQSVPPARMGAWIHRVEAVLVAQASVDAAGTPLGLQLQQSYFTDELCMPLAAPSIRRSASVAAGLGRAPERVQAADPADVAALARTKQRCILGTLAARMALPTPAPGPIPQTASSSASTSMLGRRFSVDLQNTHQQRSQPQAQVPPQPQFQPPQGLQWVHMRQHPFAYLVADTADGTELAYGLLLVGGRLYCVVGLSPELARDVAFNFLWELSCRCESLSASKGKDKKLSRKVAELVRLANTYSKALEYDPAHQLRSEIMRRQQAMLSVMAMLGATEPAHGCDPDAADQGHGGRSGSSPFKVVDWFKRSANQARSRMGGKHW